MPDNDGGQAAEAEAAERGRYLALGHPSGKGLLIYRATNLCDRCSGCGCGDQQEVIDLSAVGVMAMAGRFGKLRGIVKL